jgi:signal transduction histidine kinase
MGIQVFFKNFSRLRRLFKRDGKPLALRLFLTVIAAIFTVELGIMVSMHHFIPTLSHVVVGIIDSILLILILFPVLYFLVFQPMLSQIDERKRAEKKLKEAYEKLDLKVKERTAELSEANTMLKQEVSQRKKAQVKLKKHTEKLEAANQVKELFSDILGHDLLNPAGVVRGAAESALLDQPDSEDLQMIMRNSDKLIEIIETAGKLTKLESAEKFDKVDLDLNEVIDEVVEENKLLFESKGMSIENRVAEEMHINANPLIKEVFLNLLTNAAKHAVDGKKVIIEAKKDPEFYNVRVTDFGPGVPDKYKKDIFERFSRREKGGVKGSGLGLTISKKIVELHKGKIWIEDNPEGGSIFCVKIPRS